MDRLTSIVTRSGDDGTTGLGDGRRVFKTDTRICTIGDIDELNTVIGLAIEEVKRIQQDTPQFHELRDIQNRLFDMGGELSMPEVNVIQNFMWRLLEERIQKMNDSLESVKNFILPGGSEIAARLHHARAVCRRAERSLNELKDFESVNPDSLRYMNRLSDYLFVLARYMSNGEEVLWEPYTKR